MAKQDLDFHNGKHTNLQEPNAGEVCSQPVGICEFLDSKKLGDSRFQLVLPKNSAPLTVLVSDFFG